jgi:hypothetical protein
MSSLWGEDINFPYNAFHGFYGLRASPHPSHACRACYATTGAGVLGGGRGSTSGAGVLGMGRDRVGMVGLGGGCLRLYRKNTCRLLLDLPEPGVSLASHVLRARARARGCPPLSCVFSPRRRHVFFLYMQKWLPSLPSPSISAPPSEPRPSWAVLGRPGPSWAVLATDCHLDTGVPLWYYPNQNAQRRSPEAGGASRNKPALQPNTNTSDGTLVKLLPSGVRRWSVLSARQTHSLLQR